MIFKIFPICGSVGGVPPRWDAGHGSLGGRSPGSAKRTMHQIFYASSNEKAVTHRLYSDLGLEGVSAIWGIGCGAGELLIPLAKSLGCEEVVGSDPSQPALRAMSRSAFLAGIESVKTSVLDLDAILGTAGFPPEVPLSAHGADVVVMNYVLGAPGVDLDSFREAVPQLLSCSGREGVVLCVSDVSPVPNDDLGRLRQVLGVGPPSHQVWLVKHAVNRGVVEIRTDLELDMVKAVRYLLYDKEQPVGERYFKGRESEVLNFVRANCGRSLAGGDGYVFRYHVQIACFGGK